MRPNPSIEFRVFSLDGQDAECVRQAKDNKANFLAALRQTFHKIAIGNPLRQLTALLLCAAARKMAALLEQVSTGFRFAPKSAKCRTKVLKYCLSTCEHIRHLVRTLKRHEISQMRGRTHKKHGILRPKYRIPFSLNISAVHQACGLSSKQMICSACSPSSDYLFSSVVSTTAIASLFLLIRRITAASTSTASTTVSPSTITNSFVILLIPPWSAEGSL